jgi:hypothetical protein
MMPDRDGLSFPFPLNGTYCHGCDTWLRPGEDKAHRRTCGRKWRTWRDECKRGPSLDERQAMEAINRCIPTT